MEKVGVDATTAAQTWSEWGCAGCGSTFSVPGDGQGLPVLLEPQKAAEEL